MSWQRVASQVHAPLPSKCCPAGQRHWLLTQLDPPAQGLLHPPQWLLLLVVSTQAPAQAVVPTAHSWQAFLLPVPAQTALFSNGQQSAVVLHAWPGVLQ